LTATAYNDHNVYILGAGFANEAGLPLIKDFMNRMRDAAAWLEAQGGREREQEAIGRVLEFRLRAAAAAHRVPLNVENVEELFSLASVSGDEDLANAMPLAIAATLEYARETAKPADEWHRFQIGVLNQPDWKVPAGWEKPVPNIQEEVKKGFRQGQWYSCPPYDFYVGLMGGFFNKGGVERRDTIITFNYDLVIEESCRNLRIPVGYGFQVSRDKSAESIITPTKNAKLQVLKLHGSVNWVNFRVYLSSSEEKARPALGHEEDWELNTGHPGTRVYGDYSELRNKGFSPLLIPPTWRKDLGGDQYARIDFSCVWDAAVAALRTATNVIILGYSVPTTDLHFRYLLAAGLQDNISLRKVLFVNPGLQDKPGKEAEKKRLEEQLIGPSGLFRSEHREQGVIELIPADTREFFTGPHDIYAGEAYRVRIGRPLNPPTYTREDAPFRFSDRPENSGSWR